LGFDFWGELCSSYADGPTITFGLASKLSDISRASQVQ
jgi:hypothetical protein